MDQSLLEVLQGIQQQLDGGLATLAAQLAEVQRRLDDLQHPAQQQAAQAVQAAQAPAAAGGGAAAAALQPDQHAAAPAGGAAAADGAPPAAHDYEMPDAAAEEVQPAAEEQPAAAPAPPGGGRMQHDGGAAPAAAPPTEPAGPHRAGARAVQRPRAERRRLQPQRVQPEPAAPGGEAAAAEDAAGDGGGPFPPIESVRPDQVLKVHEDFISAALPSRPPGEGGRRTRVLAQQGAGAGSTRVSFRVLICGCPDSRFSMPPRLLAAPYRRRLPASLWQRVGMEPPPGAAGQQQPQPRQGGGQAAARRPPGWPTAFMINSPAICGPSHPSE